MKQWVEICQSIGILLVAALFVSNSAHGQAAKPLEIGLVETYFSEALNENRTLNIYLPEGFNPTDTVQYPLILIPDGGVEEDFIHITGLVRFNTQPWIARFPKSIVVGIQNTNRKRDFTFAVTDMEFLKNTGYKKEDIPYYGGSSKYIEFLGTELIPYMANKYRGSGKKTIIGESLAGLLITEILIRHSHLFDSYIIVSPSLWWGGESLISEARKMDNNRHAGELQVYIATPSKKEAPQMYREAKDLFNALKSKSRLRCYFDYLPSELHSTVLHQAVYNALKLFYPKTAY